MAKRRSPRVPNRAATRGASAPAPAPATVPVAPAAAAPVGLMADWAAVEARHAALDGVLGDLAIVAAQLAELEQQRLRLLERRDDLVTRARAAGEAWHVIGHAAGVSHPALMQRARASRLSD